MKLTTIEASISSESALRYLFALDQTKLSLCCLVTVGAERAKLEVNLDGYPHNGTSIVLNRDGTWTASTDLVIREEPI